MESNEGGLLKTITLTLPARTLVNLFLFSFLMAVIWIGFYRHLQPLFAGALIFGGVIGAWAVFNLIYSWIKAVAGHQIKTMTLDLFGNPQITELLMFALFVCAAVQVFVASIYVQHAGDKSDYTVEVFYNEQPFTPALSVSTDVSWDGRPYLARFGSRQLTFQIKGEPQYGPIEKTLKMWSSLRLRVPEDFPARKTTVIRLLPSIAVMNCYLPKADTVNPENQYDLEIKVGETSKVFSDFRKGSIYLGSSSQDLEWVWSQQNIGMFRGKLKERLLGIGVPSDRHDIWLRHWTRKPQLLPIHNFKAGDRMAVKLIRRAADAQPAQGLHERQFVINKDYIGKTTSIFLEFPCPDT